MTQEGWGPTRVGGRRRTGRRLSWLVAAVVLLPLVLGLATALYASARIERVAVEGLDGSSTGPLNLLVVGSDSRADLTPEQRRELTTGGAGGERTDTIFIMSVARGRVAMLAFPRDLWVERCDGSTGRINAAMSIGGPSCLVQTVNGLSGIGIDAYVEVKFLGFRDIVDAVGGVEVCLERPIQDPFAGIDLPAGCQVLDGKNALGFVRVRKIDSDLERIKRQQEFLRALAGKVASPGTVLNPVKLIRTAGEIGGALRADEGLGVVDLLRIGWGGRGLASGRSVTHTVPVAPATIGGAAVLQPVPDEAQTLFARYRDGSVLDAATSGPRPEEIQVRVLNGAGIGGLAGRVGEELTGKGFQVVGVGNADPSATSVIAYPPGQQASAEVVADAAPVRPELREDPEVDVVTLIMGQDVEG